MRRFNCKPIRVILRFISSEVRVVSVSAATIVAMLVVALTSQRGSCKSWRAVRAIPAGYITSEQKVPSHLQANGPNFLLLLLPFPHSSRRAGGRAVGHVRRKTFSLAKSVFRSSFRRRRERSPHLSIFERENFRASDSASDGPTTTKKGCVCLRFDSGYVDRRNYKGICTYVIRTEDTQQCGLSCQKPGRRGEEADKFTISNLAQTPDPSDETNRARSSPHSD